MCYVCVYLSNDEMASRQGHIEVCAFVTPGAFLTQPAQIPECRACLPLLTCSVPTSPPLPSAQREALGRKAPGLLVLNLLLWMTLPFPSGRVWVLVVFVLRILLCTKGP